MLVDLRVDDHEQPIAELARLYGLQDLLFGKTPRDQWLDVDDDARRRAGERLARSATTARSPQALPPGPGTENLEERVDGVDQIDPVVLRELRAR